MPAHTPPRDQALPPGDHALRPGLDQALLTRLWQRAERPGCVRHSQARTIVARHQRMTADPPLAGLLLRRGRGSADVLPAPPLIVGARPDAIPLSGEASLRGAIPLSGTVPPRATPPSARARPIRPNDLPTSPPHTRAMTPVPDAARRNRPGETIRPPRAIPLPPTPPAQRPPLPSAQPVTVTPARPGSPLQPAADSAPLVTNGADPGRPGPLPAAGPTPGTGPHPSVRPVPLAPLDTPSSLGPPAVAPLAGPGSPAASAPPPIAAGRPAPRGSVQPPGTGPGPQSAENGRPVVRAGTGGTLARPATLAWPRPAPDPAAGSVHRSVPLIREQASPGAWRPSLPAPQHPGQLPFAALAADGAAANRTAPAPGRTAPVETSAPRSPGRADLAELAVQAKGLRDPARPPAPQAPPEPPPVRRADQGRQESEAARPAIDINQIVSTVQRRLIHQMAIERERRGMMR